MTVKRKKSRLQRLVDHLPVVVFEYTLFADGHRDFTYLSPHCATLLGISPKSIPKGQLKIHSLIHPDDWQSFDESVERSVRDLSEFSWQGRCKAREKYIWLEAKGSPVKMKDGRIVYNGLFSDITDQKHLEGKHRETEQRYEDLVEQLPLGILVHTNGIIRFANATAVGLMGATHPEQLIGLEVIKIIHPDYQQMVRTRIQTVLTGESAPALEVKVIRLDGKVMDIESVGHLYIHKGEPAVQVIFTDITARKKAEASFRKTETLFYQLFQNTPLAIVLLNSDGKVVQVNKGFEELFDYKLDELKEQVLNDSIVPGELRPEGNDINSLITENRVIKVETIRQRKDGKRLSVIIYGFPVLLLDKKIGIFGMYVDITERKKVEEELKVRNTELDNFVYKVSHDLRAPLSSVLGLAHLAALPGNNDNLAEYVKLMGDKAEQLDHFISDVLSHSKNLKLDLKLEKVDFEKIIEQTFSGLSYLKGVNQLKKQIKISKGDFYSDPWRISEIFRNLASNAIKYCKPNNGNSRLDIGVEIHPEHCNISFRDEGIGIDPSSLERIFEMFYRASDQSEGSGLGLYIVKNAVEKLGGQINAESELGVGTTFKITLPNRTPSN